MMKKRVKNRTWYFPADDGGEPFYVTLDSSGEHVDGYYVDYEWIPKIFLDCMEEKKSIFPAFSEEIDVAIDLFKKGEYPYCYIRDNIDYHLHNTGDRMTRELALLDLQLRLTNRNGYKDWEDIVKDGDWNGEWIRKPEPRHA